MMGGPWFTKKANQQRSQADWQAIAYREYARLRERGMPVPGALDHAECRATGWAMGDRASIVIQFEARYQQAAIAEAVRQAHVQAALDRRMEIARLRGTQGSLFAEGVA